MRAIPRRKVHEMRADVGSGPFTTPFTPRSGRHRRKDVKIAVRVSGDLLERLDREAEATKRTLSDVLRDHLEASIGGATSDQRLERVEERLAALTRAIEDDRQARRTETREARRLLDELRSLILLRAGQR